MGVPTALRPVLLIFTLSTSIVGTAHAQIPDKPERCKRLSPQLAAQNDETPYRKVIVDRIAFDGPIHLSGADIAHIVDNANQAEFHADQPWVDELTEVWLREAWWDQGYYQAKVMAAVRSVDADSSEEHFVVTAHVDEGLQYHVGDIQFEVEGDDSDIPEAEVREAFPLREGELFSVLKVREGIQVLSKLFGTHGYIDFVMVPETRIDDNLQRISLVVRLNTERQFRIGRVDVVGLDPAIEAQVRSIVKPGEPFNPTPLDEFFPKHKAVLLSGPYPPDAYLAPYEARRNIMTGIVDVTVDFRSCPAPSRSSSAMPVE